MNAWYLFCNKQRLFRKITRPCDKLRGRLHVYESVYDSPYDSINNLPTSQIGIQFFIRHPLQWSVYTFQPKLIKNLIERGLWQEIVHRIVWQFIREIARLDGPLKPSLGTLNPVLKIRKHLRYYNFIIISLYSAIAGLATCPPDAGLQKRANSYTLIVGLAGTGNWTRSTCVAGSGYNRWAIHPLQLV
jgi:hypothetical protein